MASYSSCKICLCLLMVVTSIPVQSKINKRNMWRDRIQNIAPLEAAVQAYINQGENATSTGHPDLSYTDFLRVRRKFKKPKLPSACVKSRRPATRDVFKDLRFIKSPFFGFGYRNQMKCSWLLSAPKLKNIYFEFGVMDIEYHQRCQYDSLIFREGRTTEKPKLMKICGREPPEKIITKSRYALVTFVTDDSVTHKGYTLYYRFINAASVVVQKCSEEAIHLNNTEGTFFSPNKDILGRYLLNTVCRWKIEVPEGQVVNLTFTRFRLDRVDDCEGDNVTVYDGMNHTSPVITTKCGWQEPLTVLSTNNFLYIVFMSNGQFVDEGFNATYVSQDAPDLSDKCGVPEVRPKLSRIFGGEEAFQGSWPWVVSIRFGGNQWDHWCGGALISPDYILTAAHCLFDRLGTRQPPSEFEVIVGDHNMNQKESTETVHLVTSLTVHEGYKYGINTHDIGLLLLDKPVTETREVKPVCLPETTAKTDEPCVVVGWGDTKSLDEDNSRLRQAVVPIIARETCRSFLGFRFEKGMLCAGYEEGGKDACHGDSGGPLVCPGEKNQDKFYVKGITSWGIGCGQPKRPGVYTDVFLYLDWIKKNTLSAT